MCLHQVVKEFASAIIFALIGFVVKPFEFERLRNCRDYPKGILSFSFAPLGIRCQSLTEIGSGAW